MSCQQPDLGVNGVAGIVVVCAIGLVALLLVVVFNLRLHSERRAWPYAAAALGLLAPMWFVTLVPLGWR